VVGNIEAGQDYILLGKCLISKSIFKHGFVCFIIHYGKILDEYTVKISVEDKNGNTSLKTTPISVTSAETILLLEKANFWAYQILMLKDGCAVGKPVDSKYDMIVVEPTRTDWTDEYIKKFNTGEMVKRLQNSKADNGSDRKLILSYVDIGEPENWRRYRIENECRSGNRKNQDRTVCRNGLCVRTRTVGQPTSPLHTGTRRQDIMING